MMCCAALCCAEEEGGAGGVYRPPKLNPVSMEDVDVEEGRRFARERRLQQQAQRKAARSELVCAFGMGLGSF